MRESVRPLVASDLPEVRAVIDGVALFPSEMMDGMTTPFFAGEASDEIWLTVDAGRGAEAVAYCAPERMTSGTWNLLLIAVRPERQGQGIGAALMASVEAEARARGGRVLLVETSGLPAFDDTRRFYLQRGYVTEARIRDFYQAGEDKVVFWKALAPMA